MPSCGFLHFDAGGLFLFSALAVVREHAGGRVVDIAARPGLVGHPETDNHLGFIGIVLFEYLAVEQGFLCKRFRVGVLFALLFKLVLGVEPLGVFLEVVHHRVTHRVGERSLFAEKNVVGQVVALKGVAEQIFALAVGVQLFLGVDGHNIFHKVEVAERHARFERVY